MRQLLPQICWRVMLCLEASISKQLTYLLFLFVCVRIVPLFEKSCEKLSPRLRLFSTIPLLLNWLSFLYYFTDLPYALYLPQLWIVSLSVFLILGDASLEFDGSNVMR